MPELGPSPSNAAWLYTEGTQADTPSTCHCILCCRSRSLMGPWVETESCWHESSSKAGVNALGRSATPAHSSRLCGPGQRGPSGTELRVQKQERSSLAGSAAEYMLAVVKSLRTTSSSPLRSPLGGMALTCERKLRVGLVIPIISCAKRREYVPVGSTAASVPPTFSPETTGISSSKCHCP